MKGSWIQSERCGVVNPSVAPAGLCSHPSARLEFTDDHCSPHKDTVKRKRTPGKSRSRQITEE